MVPPTALARSKSRARDWSRLDGIDLLRGLALFFVLMNHVNMQLLFAHVPYTRGIAPQLVYSLVWNGQLGVQIFFAISGYLITATTLRRWGSLAQVRPVAFYRLRFARIGPLLLLLLALLSTLHLARVDHFVIKASVGGLPRALLAALTFHVNLLEARRGYLPGNWDILWSLSIEELFYLGFPLACCLFRKGRLLAIPLLLFVAAGPFARSAAFNRNPVWQELSYLGGMDAIALGCLTALLLHHLRALRAAPGAPGRDREPMTVPARGLVAVLGLSGLALTVFSLCFSLQAYRWGLGRNGLSMSILALGTCLLIAAADCSGWRAPRVFAPLLRLGKRSYEVYLTHMFVVVALAAAFQHAGKPMAAVPAFFLGVLLLSGLLGELVARGYTEPANRRLRQRWAGSPGVSGLAAAAHVEPGSAAPLL